ncbi:hypothetical protein RUESEDTHA_00229 [Ruegeria sp. THAF57]|nr:hypothetical protein RUESEDTHA_00229 [Ruegeria sp. THAF57]
MLDALSNAGEITHFPHQPQLDRPIAEQVSAIAMERELLRPGDWAIWLDADEFLNIQVGSGRIVDLIDTIGEARGICVSWRVFGDAGQNGIPSAFLAEPFVRCAMEGERWQNVKTFFRVEQDVVELFQHKPILEPSFWKNGGYFLASSGCVMKNDNQFMALWQDGKKRGKIAEHEAGWNIAQINHYAVRTPKLFKFKQARGRIGKANNAKVQRYNARYYSELNLNSTEDRSILRWSHATKKGAAVLQEKIRLDLDVPALLKKQYPDDVLGTEPSDIDDKNSEQVAANADVDRYRKMHEAHHDEIDQRRYSNSRLAQEIFDVLKPRSAVDVGCGIGLLISDLRELGVEVQGLEGTWLDDDAPVLPAAYYTLLDLEKPFTLERRYDLCSCIEVAEHLEPARADSFVADLCALSDVIVFSAAIGGQGGKGHKNEQWQEYWCHKFEAQGYGTYDPFRDRLRRDEKVLPWLQQNVLMFVRKGQPLSEKLSSFRIKPSQANMILPTYHHKIMKRSRRRFKRRLAEARAAN